MKMVYICAIETNRGLEFVILLNLNLNSHIWLVVTGHHSSRGFEEVGRQNKQINYFYFDDFYGENKGAVVQVGAVAT